MKYSDRPLHEKCGRCGWALSVATWRGPNSFILKGQTLEAKCAPCNEQIDLEESLAVFDKFNDLVKQGSGAYMACHEANEWRWKRRRALGHIEVTREEKEWLEFTKNSPKVMRELGLKWDEIAAKPTRERGKRHEN